MEYSKKFLKWVEDTKQHNLTRSDKDFAEFIIAHEKQITTIGEKEDILVSLYRWLKSPKSKIIDNEPF